MGTASRIAVGLAVVVLGFTSPISAATKHPARRQTQPPELQVPADGYSSYGQASLFVKQGYGYVRRNGQVERVLGETGAVLIQDRDSPPHWDAW